MLAAHGANDGPLLVRLYAEAADAARERAETDAEAFFLTQAYIFALEQGAGEAEQLLNRLKALGRDE